MNMLDYETKLAELNAALTSLWARVGWPPGHKYSPIPDIDDVSSREGKLFRHQPQAELFDIDLNESGQIAFLEKLSTSPPMVFPRSAVQGKRFVIESDSFSETDAPLLAAVIGGVKPRPIINIGSSVSTSAILDIQATLDDSPHLTIVEADTE